MEGKRRGRPGPDPQGPRVARENLWWGEKEPEKGFVGGSKKGTTFGLGSLRWPPRGKWDGSSAVEV